MAAVCVAALDAPAAKRVTVEVFSKPSPGLAKDVYEKQLQEMWTTLKPDATQPTADKPAATSAGGAGTTTASTTYAAKAAMAGDVAKAAHDADVPPVMKDAGAKPEQAAPAAMPQFAS